MRDQNERWNKWFPPPPLWGTSPPRGEEKKNGLRAIAKLVAAGLGALSVAQPARAQTDDVAAFYKGRTLAFVIGHEAGTGYDLYGRVLTRHIGRHIPGEPQVVPQNMIGGGGLHSANWLHNVAAGDGSVIATFAHTAILEPVLGSSGVKLDATRFHWIGNMDETVSTCVVADRAGVTNLRQLVARDTIYGGSGGPLTVFGAAMINLLGAKGRLVSGYKSSADVKLALARGEIDATCGMSRSTLGAQWREELASGRVRIVVQFGRQRHPELPGIDHIYDAARNDEDRQVYDLIFGATSLGRAVAAPPATPGSRVSALRAAFDAAMADPQFLSDVQKSRLDISPSSGAAVQALVGRFYAAPKAVVDRAKAASRAP